MQVALYARVSTPNQQQEGTIVSQVRALKDYIHQQGWNLLPEHEFSMGAAAAPDSTAQHWIDYVTSRNAVSSRRSWCCRLIASPATTLISFC